MAHNTFDNVSSKMQAAIVKILISHSTHNTFDNISSELADFVI